MKNIRFLCYFVVLMAIISTSVGFFYTTGGETFEVENIYGQTIELYGDGIYKNDAYFRAGINKGTDITIFAVAILFAFATAMRDRLAALPYIQIGLLIGLLYYASCMVFGVTFNALFPVYVLLFSSSLFAMIFLLQEILKRTYTSEKLKSTSFKGTAIFLIISGSSVLMWLQFIIPALVQGQPLAHIEVYTTEPTYVLDLGIILPVYLGCGIALWRKKDVAYTLTPILLTFIVIIGVLVISQTLVQQSMGIVIPVQELIGLVISFAILGLIAIGLNYRFLKHLLS